MLINEKVNNGRTKEIRKVIVPEMFRITLVDGQHRNKGGMSVGECVGKLQSSNYVKEGDVLHLFALWFLHDKIEIRIALRRHHFCTSSSQSTASSVIINRINKMDDYTVFDLCSCGGFFLLNLFLYFSSGGVVTELRSDKFLCCM